MLTDQRVIDYFTNEMVLAKINSREDTALANRYKVSAVPTLIMVDQIGQEVDRIIGYRPPQALLQTLNHYRQGIGTLDDLLSKAKGGGDRLLAFQIAGKYKDRGNVGEAEVWYDKVINAAYPQDSLSGEARMAKASVLRRAKQYDRAMDIFTGVMDDFPQMPFAVTAELWRAIIFRQQGDTASAIEAFEGFVEHHPDAKDAKYARKQIERLKGQPQPGGN